MQIKLILLKRNLKFLNMFRGKLRGDGIELHSLS